MQPCWGDVANYFGDRDNKYGTTELKVPAVVQPQTEDDATSSAPTTYGETMETLESVPGKSQTPQLTSPPGNSDRWLNSRKPQTHHPIPSLPPYAEPDLSTSQKSKHVEPISCYLCMYSPKLFPYRTQILTKKCWWLLGCWRSEFANFDYWQWISSKSNMCTYFAKCHLLLDVSDQIVRHDNLSMHVQGSDGLRHYARLQIAVTDDHWIWEHHAGYS